MRSPGFLIIIVILSGCSASGPKYTDFAASIPTLEVGKTRVFLLRPSFILGAAQSPEIEIRDQNPARVLGNLPNGSFTYFDIRPGYSTVATIRSGLLVWKDKRFVHGQYFEPGEEYYLGVKIGNPTGIAVSSALFGAHYRNESFVISPIKDTVQAKQMLQDLNYQKLTVQ